MASGGGSPGKSSRGKSPGGSSKGSSSGGSLYKTAVERLHRTVSEWEHEFEDAANDDDSDDDAALIVPSPGKQCLQDYNIR